MRHINVTKMHLIHIIFGVIITFFASCENKTTTKQPIHGSATKLPYFNNFDFTPDWESGKHKIPVFSLTNQLGKTITNTTYKNKIYIANFFFTTCSSICPKMTESMLELQEKYKDDDEVMLLSHSVMPWYDNVDILALYAKNNNINASKWNLVTGSKKDIYSISRLGYFADDNFDEKQIEEGFIHTENFILVDKNGYIRGVYNGTLSIDMDRLYRHLAILKNEYAYHL